jgi:hypothetical protein
MSRYPMVMVSLQIDVAIGGGRYGLGFGGV